MRDLSLPIPDFTPEWLAPAKLQALATIDLTRLPLGAEVGDCEIELGFVIGTRAKKVSVAHALSHVAG